MFGFATVHSLFTKNKRLGLNLTPSTINLKWREWLLFILGGLKFRDKCQFTCWYFYKKKKIHSKQNWRKNWIKLFFKCFGKTYEKYDKRTYNWIYTGISASNFFREVITRVLKKKIANKNSEWTVQKLEPTQELKNNSSFRDFFLALKELK